MFKAKERDRHVPRFNGSPGENLELWSGRAIFALDEKNLSGEFEPPGGHHDAETTDNGVSKQR